MGRWVVPSRSAFTPYRDVASDDGWPWEVSLCGTESIKLLGRPVTATSILISWSRIPLSRSSPWWLVPSPVPCIIMLMRHTQDRPGTPPSLPHPHTLILAPPPSQSDGILCGQSIHKSEVMASVNVFGVRSGTVPVSWKILKSNAEVQATVVNVVTRFISVFKVFKK